MLWGANTLDICADLFSGQFTVANTAQLQNATKKYRSLCVRWIFHPLLFLSRLASKFFWFVYELLWIRGVISVYLLTFQWNFSVFHFSDVLVMSPFSLCSILIFFAIFFFLVLYLSYLIDRAQLIELIKVNKKLHSNWK